MSEPATTHRIYPPEFLPRPSICTTPDAAWEHGCLTGWRTAQATPPAEAKPLTDEQILKLQQTVELMHCALDTLASWGDGAVGGHMDEPYAAKVAREVLAATDKLVTAAHNIGAKEQ